MVSSGSTSYRARIFDRNVKYFADAAAGGRIIEYNFTTDTLGPGSSVTLNIDSGSNWTWNIAKIHQIMARASASTDFDVEIYPGSDFTANSEYYQNTNNNLVFNDAPIGGQWYLDTDKTSKLHLKVINTDSGNSSTVSVTFIMSPMYP